LVLENNGADDVVDKRTTATDGNEKNVKSHFNTICLPTKNIELKEYKQCYVASWIFNNQKNMPM
jgi:ferredoxin-thioredoxin reductase catalytic subunit